MTIRRSLLVGAVLATPFGLASAALAQPVTGLYVAGGAGVNFKQDQDINSFATISGTYPGITGGSGAKLRYETGFVALGSVGWGFGNGLRAEVEGSYRQNSVRGVRGTAFPSISTDSQAQTYGVMVNVFYDFDPSYLFGLQRFLPQPYIGLGAGYQWTHLGGAGLITATTSTRTNDTDGNFAYQAIIGSAFPIAAVPGLAITAEYRFMGVIGDSTYRTGTFTAPPLIPGKTFGSAKVGDQFNHAGIIGVRYAFNQPPPPAPAAAPVPAAAPARSYLVFFDWDKATLSDRARQIIAEAAENSRRVQYTRIEVNGYTDTSGSPRYNQGLSVRRAQAVAAELVRLGVPRNAIAIQGFGQTRLLVPTADNVREPQNRRVEIIIR